MNRTKFSQIMKERTRIFDECQDNWGDGIEMCCKETIKVIKEDIPGFIDFLETDCSAQDYLFITDWFDEFVFEMQSQELVDAFRRTMQTRFLEENMKYNIEQDLDEAINYYGNGIIH